MNKYYNENDFCNSISELTINYCGELFGSTIDNIIGIENATEESLNSILDEIKYSIEDVCSFETIIGKKCFVVWVGGVEINDSILELKNAMDIYNYWKIEREYDDVHICTVGEKV